MDGITRQSNHRHHTNAARNKLSLGNMPAVHTGSGRKCNRNDFHLKYSTVEPAVLALGLEGVPESGDSLTGLRQVLGTPNKQLKVLYIS